MSKDGSLDDTIASLVSSSVSSDEGDKSSFAYKSFQNVDSFTHSQPCRGKMPTVQCGADMEQGDKGFVNMLLKSFLVCHNPFNNYGGSSNNEYNELSSPSAGIGGFGFNHTTRQGATASYNKLNKSLASRPPLQNRIGIKSSTPLKGITATAKQQRHIRIQQLLQNISPFSNNNNTSSQRGNHVNVQSFDDHKFYHHSRSKQHNNSVDVSNNTHTKQQIGRCVTPSLPVTAHFCGNSKKSLKNVVNSTDDASITRSNTIKFYDSDPGYIANTHNKPGSSVSGGLLLQSYASHQQQDASTVCDSIMSEIETNLTENDEHLIADFISDFLNRRISLIWHVSTDYPINERNKKGLTLTTRVQMWIEQGSVLKNSVVHPRLCWAPTVANNNTNTWKSLSNLSKMDLLDVTHIIEANDNLYDKQKYPFTKVNQGKCFLLIRGQEMFVFECCDGYDQRHVIFGLRLVIARLGAGVIARDDNIFETYFTPMATSTMPVGNQSVNSGAGAGAGGGTVLHQMNPLQDLSSC